MAPGGPAACPDRWKVSSTASTFPSPRSGSRNCGTNCSFGASRTNRSRQKAAKPRDSKHHRDPSPLAGKIFDEAGEKLTPSHTRKADRRYRYYISKRLVTGVSRADERQRTWRIPASQIEGLVADAVQQRVARLRAILSDQVASDADPDAVKSDMIWHAISRITIAPGAISIQLDAEVISKLIKDNPITDPDALFTSLPYTERRRGVEMKLVAQGTATVDETLRRNLALANQWYAQVKQGVLFEEIAADANTSKRRVQQLILLAFLAPEIVRQITRGTQPTGLTSDWLVRHSLPADWKAQQERIARL